MTGSAAVFDGTQYVEFDGPRRPRADDAVHAGPLDHAGQRPAAAASSRRWMPTPRHAGSRSSGTSRSRGSTSCTSGAKRHRGRGQADVPGRRVAPPGDQLRRFEQGRRAEGLRRRQAAGGRRAARQPCGLDRQPRALADRLEGDGRRLRREPRRIAALRPPARRPARSRRCTGARCSQGAIATPIAERTRQQKEQLRSYYIAHDGSGRIAARIGADGRLAQRGRRRSQGDPLGAGDAGNGRSRGRPTCWREGNTTSPATR